MNSLLMGVCKHLSSRVCRRACALCVGVSGTTERTDVMCVLRIWGCKTPFILEPERLGLRDSAGPVTSTPLDTELLAQPGLPEAG